eukprot:c19789_g1_i4.p1 GENE.c19789_g1_i4~~c19789_g1_i4.p1  ORF type:complete len:108 (-),score=16.20 c19789_g1_i4:389-679(-)
MGQGEGFGPSKTSLLISYLSRIPKVSKTMGIFILILNIVLPGVGSMIAGLLGGKKDMGCFWAGLLQLLLAVFIIGWIWSIFWGVKIYTKSTSFIPI